MSSFGLPLIALFLSTPSARRATLRSSSRRPKLPISIHALREEGDLVDPVPYVQSVISIHALREEGDLRKRKDWATRMISIHALREEGDSLGQIVCHVQIHFYPRPPRGGRRPLVPPMVHCGVISIHALREEGDGHLPGKTDRSQNFYPRPPRGGRP